MGKGAKKVGKFLNNQQKKREIDIRQKKYDIKKTKLNLNVNIKNIGRAIAFKRGQVDTGEVIETRTVHHMPDGTASIVDGFKDNNLKPKYLLENEIDDLQAKIIMFSEQLAELNKAEEENVGETIDG